MEHVITKHILNHLESNSLLYDLQHGFRHSRSCETQLLSFVQELAANPDKNIQTDLIIIALAKAFDKVPHQRLLFKLKLYGIKNQTLNCISAFLSYRTQTVVLDGESSDIAPVTSIITNNHNDLKAIERASQNLCFELHRLRTKLYCELR